MPGNNSITWVVSTIPQIGKTLEQQTLASFVIPTEENFLSGDSIVLEIYGSDGMLNGAYSFVDTANCGNYSLSITGWYPLDLMKEWSATDDDCANDVVVPFGSGVIITSAEANSKVTFAGQILNEAKTITINGDNGITWTGNATPNNYKIGDFAIPTDSEFLSGDSIVLEIYDSAGTLEGAYSFVDEVNCGNYSLSNPGWYPLDLMKEWSATDDDCVSQKIDIPAGKMVVITSAESDTTLTLPNPMCE